ncbi:MAG TPA: ABC transporter substrate-binding protein [Candidatus Methylomirabilis sp.]|nr:ABC transporter substrate-binding protein [Candidatus Methylomirabilis sp.]
MEKKRKSGTGGRESGAAGISRREALRRAALYGVGLAALPAIAPGPGRTGSAMAATSGGPPRRGGVLHWYLPDDPPDLDPQMSTISSTQWVLGMCYNGLLRYNVGPGSGAESEAAATPVPDLAERFEQPDPLTYIFHLRSGVRFHDGTPLTAEDVAFSLDRIRTRKAEFQRAYAFTALDSVKATGDRVVTVKLKEPYAAFINQVAAAYTRIAPKHVIEARGDMKQVIVGTGPFKLQEYRRGQRMVLVRNPDYFERGIPYLDSLEIAIMPDNATQVAAFNSRRIDMLIAANSAQAQTLKGVNPNIEVQEYVEFRMDGLGCNIQVKPFDDIRVRQAMWYAIDQQKIINISFQGHGKKQRSVPPAYAGWVVPFDKLPLSDAPNLDKAKRLLAEAGYPKGFSVKCKSVYRYTQKEATIAAEMLKAIGVNMEIIDVEYGAYLKARNSGDFEVIAFSIAPFGDVEDYTTALYHTRAGRNFGHWGNAELDKLFEQGGREGDVQKRKAIFHKVQAVLAENCWVIDLPRYMTFEAWHPHVRDYVTAQNPEKGLSFWRTWLAR